MSSTKTWFFRSMAAVGLSLAALAPAQALSLNTTGIVANSKFEFSAAAIELLEAQGASVTALGNASAISGSSYAFNLPITQVSAGLFLNVTEGEAVGSALEISRSFRGKEYGITLANFTLDFNTNQMLADLTPMGGTTLKQAAVYSFDVANDLGLKYSFPLNISLHQELDNFRFTDSAVQTFASALNIGSSLIPLLKSTDFGTITNDINPSLRLPVSAKVYTVTPSLVPENPSWALMGLGLFSIGLLRLRRRTANI